MSRQTRRTFLKVSGSVLGGLAVGSTVTAAESRDRFIVNTRSASGSLESADFEVVHDLSAAGLAVVRGSRSDVAAVASDFAADSHIRLSEPKAEAREESATDEPLYPLQWDKQVQNIPEAHETTRGEGARVAIIDSGVDATHPDLEHAVNTDRSRNFTGDGLGSGVPAGGDHGTHVAGTVAANDGNEESVVGSAPGAEIVDCRVFSGEGGASFGDVLAAIAYSAEVGADAANLSLGAYPVPREELGSFYGKSMNRVTTYANSRGTVLVMSAGNDASDLQHDGRVCVENEDGTVECFSAISLPNESAQALSVSATGPIGFNWGEEGLEAPFVSPSFYTNYGTNAVDIAAPGGDADLDAAAAETPGWHYDLVLSTVPGGYGWKAGTSMAAPQVAGAVALLRSQNPDLTADQVESKLKRAASVPEDYDAAYYGAGFIDVVGALQN